MQSVRLDSVLLVALSLVLLASAPAAADKNDLDELAKRKLIGENLDREHPLGDPVDLPNGKSVMGPCRHQLKPIRYDWEDGLTFFTSDPDIQSWAIDASRALKQLGVSVRSGPRPLKIFNRDPVYGNPGDDSDPFWSHYDAVLHSIQLTKGGSKLHDVLCHEMGHAIIGLSCTQPFTLGKAHSMFKETDPGMAVSEGWANFVALVLLNQQAASIAEYKGIDFEAGEQDGRAPYSANSEFRVACILWDVFDAHSGQEQIYGVHSGPGSYDSPEHAIDHLSMHFKDMYKVFRPSLLTLRRGPLVWNIDNYLQRLKDNFGKSVLSDDRYMGIEEDLDKIRELNLTPPR